MATKNSSFQEVRIVDGGFAHIHNVAQNSRIIPGNSDDKFSFIKNPDGSKLYHHKEDSFNHYYFVVNPDNKITSAIKINTPSNNIAEKPLNVVMYDSKGAEIKPEEYKIPEGKIEKNLVETLERSILTATKFSIASVDFEKNKLPTFPKDVRLSNPNSPSYALNEGESEGRFIS
jgi:hypothetical protein